MVLFEIFIDLFTYLEMMVEITLPFFSLIWVVTAVELSDTAKTADVIGFKMNPFLLSTVVAVR